MDYFRFTSIHYDYVPTGRERPAELWLTVESYLPASLYVGAILTLAVEPVSFVPRPRIAELFSGVQVKVVDIVGRRIVLQWPSEEGRRRAEGLDPFFGKSFGLYVAGKATYRLCPGVCPSQSSVPDSSFYAPAYYDRKLNTRNPLGLIM